MSTYNITARTSSTPTTDGIKDFYVMEIRNESKNNQLVGGIKTDDEDKAREFFAQAKNDYPNLKVNGSYNKDPFTDGTFKSTSPKNFEKPQKPAQIVSSGGGSNFSNFNQDSYEKYNQTKPSNSSSPLVPTIGFNAARITKKSRDLSGLPQEKRKRFEALTEKQRAEQGIDGVFGSKRVQARVDRESLPSEKVVARGPDNNAFIVIGNDRVSKPHTGYGGKGHTQCDSIDLCAGMASFTAAEVATVTAEDGTKIESKIKTNPNFFLDAARIYISQKTDVDKNFRIGEFGVAEKNIKDNKDDTNIGKYGAKSAIALKADNLRFISRENIRLVTGTDKFNSQGGEVLGKHGIELIAMNDTTNLQAMVLGENLRELLQKLIENIKNLSTYVHAASDYQMKFNQEVAKHTHISPFNARPTKKSETLIAAGQISDIEKITKTDLSVMKNLSNKVGALINYIEPTGQKENGDKAYILSDLNKCN